MFMPTMIRKDELVFGQTDGEFADAQDAVGRFQDDDRHSTRSIRAWIAPHTAQSIAMIARAHDVSPTVILGVIIENGVASWPGRFDTIEEWSEEGEEQFDMLDRMIHGKEEKR
jgi:hypothetical protein